MCRWRQQAGRLVGLPDHPFMFPRGLTMNLVEYDGDLSKLNGELLAGWFIANPNGPTAFALGFVEFEDSRRMFYKWMHFTGGKTWLSREVTSYFTDSDANFGEILFNELISINNEAIATGKEVKLMLSIPSFIVFNDNPQVRAALAAFIQVSLEYGKDWGKELYYLNKYRNHFFSRYEEQYREIYEDLKRDQSANADYLIDFWRANQHWAGFQEWEPNRYLSSELTQQLFDSWYEQVTDPEFVKGAAFCFAQMWVGASAIAEHSGFLRKLKDSGKYESLTDTLNFFENANRPLLPAEIDEACVRNCMKL
jgi:hypothetical protein